MPRPRRFTEEDVVASAGEAFSERGYEGTTLEDLVKATGLGKQSLYNSFGGKHDLFLRALAASAADAVAAVDEALAGPDATPLERIRAQMFKVAIALGDDDGGGSLVTKAAVELGHRDTDVAGSALHVFTRLENSYRQCIMAAQQSGEIDPGADAGALAAFFVAVTRGMEVLANAGIGRAQLTAVALTSLQALPESGKCRSEPT